ncbi:UDP-4-amino-4,6-dideoxy-N-acetyl-beta-L-altrosamine N-acetyltransferase [Pelosinus fermentans]|uniref:Pseudaminic acid biosynthesis N-acetyl transferase n=1 Tax=Pelosinus fermentans JBW45 TaxID=1192197 RepID=I8TW67_9FIRM|nr:UDP-4-amino-4,6-dideoxy-N-acetyl-beta-L-altrosamine N-acetyltransferase [Pelosinus fermentans]AJQ26096.1 pseudaminic acid biosynthesis N-acetyl transferase [Pelosinus fermentans JBW45]
MLRFDPIREEDLELVLSWRTKQNITQYMYTDISKDLEEQKKWHQRISLDPTCCYWLIHYQEKPIGVIGLSEIDAKNKRCSLTYYIGDETVRGLGGIIPPYIYNYVFTVLQFKKIIAEVMEGNDQVVKLHQLHGYRHVGIYKEHIYKYDKYHDVTVLELLDVEWQRIGKRYKKCNAHFAEN